MRCTNLWTLVGLAAFKWALKTHDWRAALIGLTNSLKPGRQVYLTSINVVPVSIDLFDCSVLLVVLDLELWSTLRFWVFSMIQSARIGEVKAMRNIELGFLLCLLLFNLVFPFSCGETDGVCISQGGRFPPFSSEGKPPKKVGKGHKDLTLCRMFRKRTCCDAAQTHPALLSIRRLALTGEASQECLHLWESLECSICDPRVGVQPGPPLICTSFCDRVFQACSNAYFSMDAKTQVLAPCGVNDFVCGRASEWASNGTELCHAAGFGVKQSDLMHDRVEEMFCYGDKASLDSIADSWGAAQSEKPHKTGSFGFLEDFQQWLQDMPSNERVSWAVGGMVLTAGLLFISKRKSHSQRQKLAAIQRAARTLEGKMTQKSASSSRGNRKGNRR